MESLVGVEVSQILLGSQCCFRWLCGVIEIEVVEVEDARWKVATVCRSPVKRKPSIASVVPGVRWKEELSGGGGRDGLH